MSHAPEHQIVDTDGQDPFLELDRQQVKRKRRLRLRLPSWRHIIHAIFVALALLTAVFIFFAVIFQFYTESCAATLIAVQLACLSAYEVSSHIKAWPLTLVIPHPVFVGFLLLYNLICALIELAGILVEDEVTGIIGQLVAAVPSIVMAGLELRAFVLLILSLIRAYSRSKRKQQKKPTRETGRDRAQKKHRMKAGDTDAKAILAMSSLSNYSMAEDLDRLLNEEFLRHEEVRQMRAERWGHVRHQLLRDGLRSSYLYALLTPMLFFAGLCLAVLLQDTLTTFDGMGHRRTGFYTTSGGRTLHVYCGIGPDLPHDDPTKQGHLIMLDAGHGLPGMVWYRAVLDLAAEMDEPLTICYYDKPGLGWSTLPMFYRPTAADYVTTLHDAIKAALANDPQTVNPRSSVTLVSHGTAALYMPEFVAKHPDLVDHVVTVDGYSANMTGQVEDTVKPFTSRLIAMLAPLGVGRLWAHSMGAPSGFTSSKADAWVALNSRTTQWIAQMAEAEDIGSLLASNKKYAKPGVLGGIPLSVIVADVSSEISGDLWAERQQRSTAMLAWSCAPAPAITVMRSGHHMMVDIPMKLAGAIINNVGRDAGSCDDP
ncbi:Alpha/beta hydrolase family [Carpediemonas membranifera]|uniref:Alpha/beta hydrolase family n=1 Tax=Carpediemonas membranifera TaxID=201153 RepID=A0A8J6BV35_9EUKA|nr:Alpha/beta hydrolase family [Carpediemonas membranifera]|eukprot:KAG9391011.1 Alpha/beta hydrolase family [Carpediemonas membranifera]